MRLSIFLCLLIFSLRLNAQAPANDEACTATLMTVSNACSFLTATNENATTSPEADPGCGNYNGGDVWFQLVVPQTGIVTVTTQPGSSLTDGAMAFYTGTCNSLTQLDCDGNNAPGSGSMPEITATGLTPGTTLWIRFWESNNNDFGTFEICATTPIPPVNDEPCGAIELNANATCSNTVGNNVNATASTGVPDPVCGNYAGGDVWYKTVVPSNGHLFVVSSAGTITNGAIALYKGSCNGLTLLACENTQGPGEWGEMSFVGLTPNDTIFIRVWDENNNDQGDFNICVTNNPIVTPPSCNINTAAGATCETATPICNLDGYCGNTITYTANYWPEMLTTFRDCLGNNNANIQNNSFLKFVAGATSADFNVWVTSTTKGIGIQMMFFEAATCGAGDVFCHGGYDDIRPGPEKLITATNLIPGNTYYLMIDGVSNDLCDYVIGAVSGISSLSVTGASSVCRGNSISLTAGGIVSIGTTYTWNWNDANGIPQTYTGEELTDIPTQSTAYTVTASGVGICSQTQTINVTVNDNPTADIAGNNSPICDGSSAIFNLTGTADAIVTYNINGGADETVVLTGGIATISQTASTGTMVINLTSVSLGTCTNALTVSSAVNVNPLPTASIAGNNSPVCVGSDGSFDITGTPDATLTYQIDGAANQTLTLSAAGTGTVNITNLSAASTLTLISISDINCSNTLNATSTISVNSLTTPSFNQYGPFCKGAPLPQVMLPNTSIEGITGTWNPAMLSTADTGSISHVFTPDPNQCASPFTMIVVVNPIPENVDAGPGFTINAGNTVTLQGSASGNGNTYTWSPSFGLSSTSVLTPLANPDNTTTYYLEVENSFGCTDKDSTIIVVNEECLNPMKAFTPNNDGFYDKWIVFTQGCVKAVQANVYNRYGGLVYQSGNYQNDWNGTYKGNALPDATYYFVLVIVDNNNKKYTRKGSVTIMR